MKPLIKILKITFVISLLFIVLSCRKEEITVMDNDGNLYNTVKIGTQVWFKENLMTTRFNDGTSIPGATIDTTWYNLTTSGVCAYQNSLEAYKPVTGLLYNWYSVNTGKLCPVGWHVPTDDEWYILGDGLGGNPDAGGKLKEMGFELWDYPNIGATNETGFTALPGGCRWPRGSYKDFGKYGYWWSSTQHGSNEAWSRHIYFGEYSLGRGNSGLNNGYSVRCIKD
jgi:uncharacterized protein (TIGR02145 family)